MYIYDGSEARKLDFSLKGILTENSGAPATDEVYKRVSECHILAPTTVIQTFKV